MAAEKVGGGGRSADLRGAVRARSGRKCLAVRRRERFWKLAATALSLSTIVLISAEIVYASVAKAEPAREQTSVENDELRIPVSELKDHNLHRFAVNVQGREVHLIAMLDASDTVRVALDACSICGNQGYYQRGQNLICRNCGAAIYAPTIGHVGGCNPIPFEPPYQVNGDTIEVSETALEAAAGHFRSASGSNT